MKERQFRVRWEIDVWATSPKKAAEKANEAQRAISSIATIYQAHPVNERTGKIGKPVEIDLLKS
jgi:hypothetical protein